MNRYQAHVTDEWQRDTMVVQVRQLATNDTTQAIAYMAEDTDGMATLHWHPVDPSRGGREHLDPTPGVRIPHDVAVAMARAILTDAGKDADEVERLRGNLEKAHAAIAAAERRITDVTAERDLAQAEVRSLELLVEAKDAHLEREARVATLHVRVLEMGQSDAEHEQARRHHPAMAIQDRVNGALAGMARVQETGTFPQKAD